MNIQSLTPEQIIEGGEYDYLTALCKSVDEDMDKGRWIIGDSALAITKNYGKDTIGQFALDIQLAKSKVQGYRAMSAYWTKEYRKVIEDDFAVNWSILKVAKRFKDIETSMDFLERCASQEGITTVDHYAFQAGLELGASTKPQKLIRANFSCLQRGDGTITLISDKLHPDTVNLMELGATYTIDIYEVVE